MKITRTREWKKMTAEEAWKTERPSMRKLREINIYREDNAYPGCQFSLTLMIDRKNDHAYVNDVPHEINEAFHALAAIALDRSLECKFIDKRSWITGPTKCTASIDEIMSSGDSDLFTIWDKMYLRIWFAVIAAFSDPKGTTDDIIFASYDEESEFGTVKVLKGSDEKAVTAYVNNYITGDESLSYTDTEDYKNCRMIPEIEDVREYCKPSLWGKDTFIPKYPGWTMLFKLTNGNYLRIYESLDDPKYPYGYDYFDGSTKKLIDGGCFSLSTKKSETTHYMIVKAAMKWCDLKSSEVDYEFETYEAEYSDLEARGFTGF